MRPRLTQGSPSSWLHRLVVLALGVVGLLLIALHHAPVTTWAIPLHLGESVEGWQISELRRLPTRVHVTLTEGTERLGLDLVHLRTPPESPTRALTAHYRLTSEQEVPPALVNALVERLEAWHGTWPAPPAFVRATGARATPLQQLELLINQLAVLGLLLGLVEALRRVTRQSPRLAATDGAALALALSLHVGLVWWWGTMGVWHANQHGHDRLADLVQLTPIAQANLSLLHGQGYYVLMQPLVGGLSEQSVLWGALAVSGMALVPWYLWMRGLLGSTGQAAAALVVLVCQPVWVRVAGTESMYVPVLLYLGLALWWFEQHLWDDDDASLVHGLVAAFLVMQTRAEMILLVPAWITWRMLCRRPGWLRSTARRPTVLLALVTAAAAMGPRLYAFRHIDKPGSTGTSLYDAPWDPRALLGLVLLLGVGAAVPWVRQLAARRMHEGAPQRRLAGLGVLLLLAAWMLTSPPRPEGFPPWWAVSPLLDTAITAPWWPLLGALGAWRWLRQTPADGAFVLVALAGAWLVYLPRHDCLSTYVRTSLCLVPWFAVLVTRGLWSLPRQELRLVVLGTATFGSFWWSEAWLDLRYPKQQQGDLLVWVKAHISPSAILVYLADEDLPSSAPVGLRPDRTRLDHHLGPAWRTATLTQWASGDLPADAEVVFVHTADCHRVVLTPSHQAWTGERLTSWAYRGASIRGTEPRITVEGLDQGAPYLHPLCALAEAQRTHTRLEVSLQRKVAGSIYEELQGTDAHLGVYELPSRPTR